MQIDALHVVIVVHQYSHDAINRDAFLVRNSHRRGNVIAVRIVVARVRYQRAVFDHFRDSRKRGAFESAVSVPNRSLRRPFVQFNGVNVFALGFKRMACKVFAHVSDNFLDCPCGRVQSRIQKCNRIALQDANALRIRLRAVRHLRCRNVKLAARLWIRAPRLQQFRVQIRIKIRPLARALQIIQLLAAKTGGAPNRALHNRTHLVPIPYLPLRRSTVERKQRHAPVRLARLDGGEEVVERFGYWREFVRFQVGIAVGSAGEDFRRNHVRQVVVVPPLFVEFVDDVVFKRTRRPFNGLRPVRLFAFVGQLGALCHRGIVERPHQASKCTLHLYAHAYRMIWVWFPVFRAETLQVRVQPAQLFQSFAGQFSCGFALADHHKHWIRIVRHIPMLVPLTAHPAEIIVQRVEPLVREAARALCFGEVDDNQIRLEVSGGASATATRTEANAKRSVQTDSLRGNVEHVGQVVQRVICLVEHPLPLAVVLALLDPVAKLHATEAKRLREHLWRHVLPAAPVFAFAQAVFRAAHVFFLDVIAGFHVFPRGAQFRLAFVAVNPREDFAVGEGLSRLVVRNLPRFERTMLAVAFLVRPKFIALRILEHDHFKARRVVLRVFLRRQRPVEFLGNVCQV